jgi:hypothetical protein
MSYLAIVTVTELNSRNAIKLELLYYNTSKVTEETLSETPEPE